MGCRSIDGIVLVADKKITSVNALKSISFDYKQKMFGVLGGVVFGSSGSTDTFELFRDHILDQVKSRTDIRFENVVVKLAEIVLEMNRARSFREELNFDLLVAVRYPDDKPSDLTHISIYGTKRLIETYHVLGIGGVYGNHFLKELWHPDITMEKAAEIGWFIIKYIEDHELHSSVGVGKNGYPQIWFIPNDERDKSGQKRDYQVLSTERNLFTRIKKNVQRMCDEDKKHLKKLINT